MKFPKGEREIKSMLMSFEETSRKIASGALLHIAGSDALLKKLPRGNWAGGSAAYFMDKEGGRAAGKQLFVTEFPFAEFKVASYGADTIRNVAADAFDNGFSIVIIPFGCAAHKLYAEEAPGFEGMFIKNIAGWVAGFDPDIPGQTPVAVNGQAGAAHSDTIVALHIGIPEDKAATIGVIDVFSQDEDSPVIEFLEDGFSAVKCLVNGEERILADYIAQNKIDTKLPLVGDYSGSSVNVSFKSICGGAVSFYAPVFRGIKYKTAKAISDYAEELYGRLADHTSDLDNNAVFSCNSVLNFLYGGLEGKSSEDFQGPVTFGEIAFQLVNQTLVYVSVI